MFVLHFSLNTFKVNNKDITKTSVHVTMVSLLLTLNTFNLSILKRFCISGKFRLVFSRFLDLRGNLGNVKEKPTSKTCFSRE